MYPLLSDLRILTLALQVEEAFERYESSLRSVLPLQHVRADLEPIFEDGPAHKALREAHERLRKEVFHNVANVPTLQLLQVMLECERAAREFYLNYLDRLSDPRLVELFRNLAEEERVHARTVEGAMDRAEGRVAPPGSAP